MRAPETPEVDWYHTLAAAQNCKGNSVRLPRFYLLGTRTHRGQTAGILGIVELPAEQTEAGRLFMGTARIRRMYPWPRRQDAGGVFSCARRTALSSPECSWRLVARALESGPCSIHCTSSFAAGFSILRTRWRWPQSCSRCWRQSSPKRWLVSHFFASGLQVPSSRGDADLIAGRPRSHVNRVAMAILVS
jgi:hypothetical protein